MNHGVIFCDCTFSKHLVKQCFWVVHLLSFEGQFVLCQMNLREHFLLPWSHATIENFMKLTKKCHDQSEMNWWLNQNMQKFSALTSWMSCVSAPCHINVSSFFAHLWLRNGSAFWTHVTLVQPIAPQFHGNAAFLSAENVKNWSSACHQMGLIHHCGNCHMDGVVVILWKCCWPFLGRHITCGKRNRDWVSSCDWNHFCHLRRHLFG